MNVEKTSSYNKDYRPFGEDTYKKPACPIRNLP
jgi:hypothetical protein